MLSDKSNQPLIMGVLNVTPDSFYDGGRYDSHRLAMQRAEQMVAEGVDIIDIGGESTRPGAPPVTPQEELDRVIPIIKVLTKELIVPISIDTRNASVMQQAMACGATMINDVNALQDTGAIDVAKNMKAQVCLMHMAGQPQSMQMNPTYDNVVEEIYQFLAHRVAACVSAGIPKKDITIDPGFGFGKTLNHNLQLLGHLARFKSLGCRVLVGLSRKSMFGKILNNETSDRLYGSLAGALLGLLQGADIIRTHDVKATKDVLEVYQAVKPFWLAPEQFLNQRSEETYA